jgi:Rad3-related DNA helicase
MALSRQFVRETVPLNADQEKIGWIIRNTRRKNNCCHRHLSDTFGYFLCSLPIKFLSLTIREENNY